MENRRIYLPPIQDMLNRSNTYVEQNEDNYDQSQVMDGYETHFTSTQISSPSSSPPQSSSAIKAIKVNKSNFNGQLFNTPDINNRTHSNYTVSERELSSVDERTYHHNSSPSSSYTPPSPSSPSSPSHSELLQMDIPKYHSPHSRSYSDHFLHNHNDHNYRSLSDSFSSSSISRSPPPPISPQQQQQQQQQQKHVNNNNQYYQPVNTTTIFQHSQHPRHSHPRQHRRATSDITHFPQERREYTANHVRYSNNNGNRSSLDEDVIILSQQQEFSSSPPPSSSSSPPSSTASNTHCNRYQCSQCSKTFSRPSSLKIHIYSHTGEKPHVCPHPGCGRRFSVQSNMRRHLKVHYCGPQSQKDQNYLGKLPLNGDSQSSNLFISEGGGNRNTSNNGGGGSDFYRYSSVSRA